MRALGENKSVDDRLWPLPATPQTARSLPLCRTRRRMLQGQLLSPSSRVRAYLPQVARSTLMPQFKHGQARSNGRAPSMPRGSLWPYLGLNRNGHCHGSIRLQGRQCRSWVHRLPLARQYRRSGRADLTARTNTARSVRMMNHPRPSDYALLTCVAVAAVAAFLALAAMLSQLSCTPERPPEEYVPIRLVPLE